MNTTGSIMVNTLTTDTDKLILQTLKQYKMDVKLYLVGGVVRDFFLGKPNKDRDYVIIGMSLKEIKNAISNIGSVTEVGKSFGIVTAIIDGKSYDFAVPRREISTGAAHTDFIVDIDNVSLLEDLKRRDFTMNAIAYDISEEIYIDPNEGIKDIKNKIIRFCGNELERYIEDPLRLLRMLQFVNRFKFDYKVPQFIYNSKHIGLLKTISSDRIFEEYKKLFTKTDVLNSHAMYNSILGKIIYKTLFLVEPDMKFLTIDAKLLSEEMRVNIGLIMMFGKVGNYSGMKLPNINKEYIETFRNLYLTTITEKTLTLFKNKFIMIDLCSIVKLLFWKDHYLIDKVRNITKTPISIKEMCIDGNELMNMGIKPVDIGPLIKKLSWELYSGKINNVLEEILPFINNYKRTIYG